MKFVQQIGGERVRPSQAGLEAMHVGVGQRLRPVVAHGWVSDDASGRVEPV